MQQQPDINQQWIQILRQTTKTTVSYACVWCPDRKICISADALFNHAKSLHPEKLPPVDDTEGIRKFRQFYENESAQKKYVVHPEKPKESRASQPFLLFTQIKLTYHFTDRPMTLNQGNPPC